jgi:hypothetical protein
MNVFTTYQCLAKPKLVDVLNGVCLLSVNDSQFSKRLVNGGAIGATVGLSLASGVMWFDVSAIGTMISASAENTLTFSLFLGGLIAKGALLGFTCVTGGLRVKGWAVRDVSAPMSAAMSSRA